MNNDTILNDENIADTTSLVSKDDDSELGEENVFNDIRYICNSTSLITESLQAGWDIAQLPNGDVIVTEIVTVNVLYSWDKIKQKMVKVSHS